MHLSAIKAPHPPLTKYYQNEADRSSFVQQMFDNTAEDYERMEYILGLGHGAWYRGQALKRAGLKVGMRMVDIGVGTGLVAREAVSITGDAKLVVGVDPSSGMLANAHVPPEVVLVEGRAETIPFPDNYFDFLSMGYALRHISDLSIAFREFYRVLKPDARLCLLEITRPESRWGYLLLKFYMKQIIPMIAMIVGRHSKTRHLWRYYWDTIEACIPPTLILDTLIDAGFTEVRRHIENKSISILTEYQALRPN